MRPESWYLALNLNVSNEITKRRTALEWSLYRLANESGISWNMVKAVETGKHRPSIETLARLAVALGTTPSEIFRIAEKEAG